MHVLLVGATSMALRLARELMSDHQVVSLRHEGAEPRGFENLDVETVFGLPTSTEALKLAHVRRADVFIGCSDSDEQNIVACLAAQRLGAGRTICVLSRPGFLNLDEGEDLAESLGIDEVVRPSEQLAQEIVRIVTVPGALDVRVFNGGRVSLLEYRAERGSPITRGPIKSLGLPRGVLLVMLIRDGSMVVPKGGTVIEPGDKVIAMGRGNSLRNISALLRNQAQRDQRRAAIVGAGSVGLAIARGLADSNWDVKVIEASLERCEDVAGRLGSLVLHGDGTDLELLEQERIGETPVVVCVTNNDERNLLISLLVKSLGAKRVVTRADRLANERIFEKAGVDVVLSARGAAVRSIVRSVDAENVGIRAELERGSACVIELQLPESFPRCQLMALTPPESAVVGAITRRRRVIIPGGTDELCPGDEILVFCATEHEQTTREFFATVKE